MASVFWNGGSRPSAIRQIPQQPEALEPFRVRGADHGDELQTTGLLTGGGEGRGRRAGLFGIEVGQQPAIFQARFQDQLVGIDLQPHRLETRQPAGDPDCKLGVKQRRNAATEAPSADHPAPTTDAKPAAKLQVGVDIFWGYASGIIVTRMPDGTEVVLAERTRPFHESDISHFRPLLAQVEARLGRRPRYGAFDAAFDAHYVYDYFHEAGGFAAVPLNPGKRGAGRQFRPDGTPLCAAGLPMRQQLVYLDRTSGLEPHERAKYDCPLLHPAVTGEACPCNDPHFAKGGCTTTIANTTGARIRHELDRAGDDYKTRYAMRTMVERINSQAEALDILQPKLRRGQAIVNANTLRYVLINLRALQRVRADAAAKEGQLTQS